MSWHPRHASLHSSLHHRAPLPSEPESLLRISQDVDSHIIAKRQGDYASQTYGSSGSSSGSGSGSDSSSDSSGSGSDSSSGSGSDSSSGSGSGSSGPTSNDGPSTTSIAIACGVVIPLVAALILFIYLHRRNVKRQRIEDATDKHGSLDFGLGEVRHGQGQGKKFGSRKNPPEMAMVDEHAIRTGRGLSVDIGSPYVLPGDPISRTSFNSMSRDLQDGEDPYRPVKMLRSGQNSPTSMTSPSYSMSRSNSRPDNSSLLTVNSKSHLVGNSHSASVGSPDTSTSIASPLEMPVPPLPIARKPVGSPLGAELEDNSRSELDSTPFTPPPRGDSAAPQLDHQLTTNFESSFHLPDNIGPFDDAHTSQPPPPPPKRSSLRNAPPEIHEPPNENYSDALDDYTTYADVLGIAQADKDQAQGLPTINEPSNDGLGLQGLDVDNNRYSTHIRPLPVVDPNDSAEQRANRIRSFYREYFDESNDNNQVGGYADYYEDYGEEFYNDATIYDPATGQFIMPGAPYGQPIGRRAMTPPPRGPPKFRGGPGFGTRSSGGTYSGGQRQRAFSSASGRPPMGGARGRPRKKLPPPTPLHTLPTPSNLKEDTAIFNALDFAPPTTFRDRQAGRPDSPGGGQARPYSPAVRAYSPLVSSFDDLAVMPSPHMLRKSTTFTALDFAMPPRFKDMGGGGSDNGSIRSGRSGRSGHVTPMQTQNIRQGAYRVSRLPPEMVGTKDDLAASLRPKMSMVSQA